MSSFSLGLALCSDSSEASRNSPTFAVTVSRAVLRLIARRYELSSSLLVSRGVDDPVNASPVHLFGGIVGALGLYAVMQALFACVSDCDCSIDEA